MIIKPRYLAVFVAGFATLFSVCADAASALVGTIPADVSVDNRGAANISVPLQVAVGRAGLEPKLAISYNSQAGNGPLGIGWSISTGYPQAITRGRTILARDGVVNGPTYSSDDKLYLDGKRLLCVSGVYGRPGSIYRTEVDSFVEITAFGSTDDIEGFRMMTKDGMMLCFGKNVRDINSSQVYSENDGYYRSWLNTGQQATMGENATSWYLKWVEDPVGNYIKLSYACTPLVGYPPGSLTNIHYTGNRHHNILPNCKIVMKYWWDGSRPDGYYASYSAGRYDRCYSRVGAIEIRRSSDADGATSNPIRSYKLGYEDYSYPDTSIKPGLLRLNEVVRCDYDGGGESTTNVVFKWGETQAPKTFPAPVLFSQADKPVYSMSLKGDFNGDGRDDVLLVERIIKQQLPSGAYEYGLASDAKFHIAYNGRLNQLTPVVTPVGALGGVLSNPGSLTVGDFNGDQYTDLIWYGTIGSVKGWYVSLSTGQGFAAPALVYQASTTTTGSNGFYWDYSLGLVGDFDGDGLDDFLITATGKISAGGQGGSADIIRGTRTALDVYTSENGEMVTVYLAEPAAVQETTSSSTVSLPGSRWILLTNHLVNGSPTFTSQDIPNPTTSIPGSFSNAVHLEVTDLDNDGKADLLGTITLYPLQYNFSPAVNTYVPEWRNGSEVRIWSLRNLGAGNFRLVDTGIASPLSVTVPDSLGYADPMGFYRMSGDVNGDGLSDIVYLKANYTYDGNLAGTYQMAGQWHVGLSKGDGTFDLQSFSGFPVMLQSVNDDGEVLDTFKTFNRRPGDYMFGPVDDNYFKLMGFDGFEVWGVHLMDINGDGKKDFVFYDKDKGWYCLLAGQWNWDGSPWGFDTWHAPIRMDNWPTSASALPWRCVSMDIDGNGREDLVFAGPSVADEPRGSEPFGSAGMIWPLNNNNTTAIWTALTPSSDEYHVVGVTNALGSTTEIAYSATTDLSIYTQGAPVSYPIRSVVRPSKVVSDIFKDAGGGAPAHFTYQYSGARTDLSGRGFLGFHSFVTLDAQTNLFKYQFLTQSFPMTGLTAREQTYRYWADGGTAKFRLISSHDNTVIFDEVVKSPTDTTRWGTVYPFISKAVESRYEDSATDHFSFGPASPSSQPEMLFSKARPAGAHITIKAESLFDEQSSVQTTLPGSYRPSDRSTDWSEAGVNSVTGVPNYADFQALDFPGKISYGNLKQLKTDFGDGFKETLTTTYMAPVGPLTGLVQQVSTSVESNDYGTQAAPTKRFTYWESTPLVHTETVDAEGSELDTTTTYNRVAANPGRVSSVSISGYDNPGSPQHVGTYTVSENTAWDDRFDLPTSSKDAYGHTTTTAYHAIFGLPVSVIDANGAEAKTTYDPLGRVINVTDVLRNLSTDTIIAWDDSQTVSPPDGVVGLALKSVYRITTTATVKPAVSTYYDRLGRVIRTIKDGFAGQKAIADTIYNTLGQVVAVSNPYASGAAAVWTTTTYDALGRAKTVTAPNKTVTTNSYHGRITQVTVDALDREAQKNTTLVDAKGRTVSVWNADNEPALEGSDAAKTSTTPPSIAYKLDGFGRMRETALKGQSAVIKASYDALGRQTLLNDPDKGSWSYINNALGQVVWQKDANQSVTTSTFDRLGRPLTRTTAEKDNGPVEKANWYYYEQSKNDALHWVAKGNKGWIGALQRDEAVTEAAPGYGPSATSTINYYDAKGQPEIVLSLIDGRWLYTVNGYDGYSRLETVRRYWRPGGEEPSPDQATAWQDFGYRNVYDTSSYIVRVEDTQGNAWWIADPSQGYDHRDRPLKYTKGGAVTQRTYDPEDGLLTNINTTGLQSLTFGYDGLGNLLSRDAGNGRSETFRYDELNRLEWSSKTGSIEYEDNGNIRSKTSVANVSSGLYVYDPIKPHAVKTAFGYEMTYDANGNLLTRKGQGHEWTTKWAGFDKPRWLARDNNGDEFVYNANRSRVMHLEFDQLSGSAPSHYTKKKIYGRGGSMELDYRNPARMGASWLLQTVRMYVPSPDGTAGAMEYDHEKSSWHGYVYHQDHLGSTDVISDLNPVQVASDKANRPTRYSYDAWGERRNADSWEGVPMNTTHGGADDVTPRGFTGHEMMDGIGLVHMNGRIYDPLLGRMLSADVLVQNPRSLQDYNRYSYVINNPMSQTDPSGFCYDNRVSIMGPAQIGLIKAFGAEKAEAVMTFNRELDAAQLPVFASMLPLVGNYQDLQQAKSGEMSPGLILLTAFATYLDVGSGGFAPNVAGVRHAISNAVEAGERFAQKSAQIAKTEATLVDNAIGAARSLDIPDAPRSTGIGGELSSTSPNTTAPDFVFRGDTRPSETIFSEGFTAKGSNTDLLAHAFGEPMPPSGFVSTSTSREVAESFANNVYIVRNEGGIDVNATLGSMSPNLDELEVAFKGKIEPTDIRAMTDTQRGLSLLNPNWRK